MDVEINTTQGRKKAMEKPAVKDKEGSNVFAWFHATSVNGGAMVMAAAISSFFSVYMTDTLKIPAAVASAIMLIASLWDAINDPMMGVIADRTHTRHGRYRPYFIAAPLLVTFFASMIWIDWGLSPTAKAVYTLIMYIGYGMTVTMYTMPQMAILPAVVRDNNRRNVIVTMGAGCMAAAFTIGNTFTPQITGFFRSHGMNIGNGYVPFMVICGILACISFWGLYKVTDGKEKYLQPIDKSESPLKNLGVTLKHKEIIPNIIAWVMASLGYGLMFATSVYYMMYYYMRPDLIAIYMGVVSVGALVSMVVFMPIFLKIFKTGQRAIMASQIIAMAFYLFLFFFGRTNFVVTCIFTFLATAAASMQNGLVNILVNDYIDFIRYKEGKSVNGIVSSIKGFAQKCGNTISNSGILAALALSGYVAGKIGGQNASTMFTLNALKFLAPCVTGVILIICVAFNPVSKYSKEIEQMKEDMKGLSKEQQDE